MLKRLIASLLVIMSLTVVGCSKTKEEVKNKNFTTEMTQEDVKTYKAIGEDSVAQLDKNTSADTLYRTKYEAIYQAVFTREATKLASKITVDTSEVEKWLKENPNKSQAKVLTLSGEEEWSYYLYPDDPLTKDKNLKVGDNFLGAKVLGIKDSDDEAKRVEAEDNIRAAKLVEAVNERVSHVIDIRSEE